MAGALTARGPSSTTARSNAGRGLIDDLEQAASRLWGEIGEGWFAPHVTANMDIAETESTLEVKVDLPGMKASEIDISLSDNILTISGEREEQKEEKGKSFHRVERSSGRFSRTTSLPCSVEEGEAVAEFHDGVLCVTLPKAEEAKSRKIEVKS
ncbi:MAG: Hsp20/alpha crystallin family protein [Lacipirellulaceae bacterium]